MKRYRANSTGSVEDTLLLSEELSQAAPGQVLTLPSGYFFTKLSGNIWGRKESRRQVHSIALAVILKMNGGQLE